MNVPIKIGFPEFIVTAIAAIVLVFNYTYVQQDPQIASDILFAVVLIILGFVLSNLGKFYKQEDHVDAVEERKITYWFTVSLAGSIMISILSPFLNFDTVQTTNLPQNILTTIAITYGILIAVGEEWFFRGFLGNLILSRVPLPSLGSFLNAIVFMAYHSYVYHDSNAALVAVLFGGYLICYADFKTGRMITGMLTHMSVNLIAVGLKIVTPVAFALMAFHLIPAFVFVPICVLPILAKKLAIYLSI